MFRFTIRDVLWLMVVVGLSCEWWMDRERQSVIHAREIDKLAQTIKTLENQLLASRIDNTNLSHRLDAMRAERFQLHYRPQQ